MVKAAPLKILRDIEYAHITISKPKPQILTRHILHSIRTHRHLTSVNQFSTNLLSQPLQHHTSIEVKIICHQQTMSIILVVEKRHNITERTNPLTPATTVTHQKSMTTSQRFYINTNHRSRPIQSAPVQSRKLYIQNSHCSSTSGLISLKASAAYCSL